MTRLSSGASTTVAVLNAVLAVPVAYLGALTLISRIVASRGRSAPPTDNEPTTRFVVLVPAHDEASSIAEMVASALTQRYPRPLFAVHVVADNCADATAELANAAGATAHERFDLDDRGKGPALNWLVRRLIERGEVFDVAVFVDADTTLDREFLRVLDDRFRQGAVAVQGQYLVREAFMSPSTALRFCSLASRHHARPLARTAIGGSCGLFGNGMAFRRDIVAERRWTSHLVEDMEFQLELLLTGIRVDYEPLARLEAEMPDSLEGSVTQHRRWELGRFDMVRRYGSRLLRTVIRGRSADGGSGAGRVAATDALLDMCVPPMSLLASATGLAAASGLALAVAAPQQGRGNAIAGAALTATVCLHVIGAMRSIGAPKEAYRALLHTPRLAVWKIGLLLRSEAGSQDEWIRTERNAERAVESTFDGK